MSKTTYVELLLTVRSLAKEVRQGTEEHRKLASAVNEQAQDTGRIAEQIAALRVDAATIAETREISKIMRGLSENAIAYANTADNASRQAAATEQSAIDHHGGIKEAADRSTVPMASSSWYTQE